MNFDDIPLRMKALDVDRPWVAANTGYAPAHLANILAPNGDKKSKTAKALRLIWEALDREEERQRAASTDGNFRTRTLLVEMTAEENRKWSQAQRKNGSITLEDWAVETLNAAVRGQDQPVNTRPTLLEDWNRQLPKIVG